MDFQVEHPPQPFSYDPLKSPTRSHSSQDGMEPLLQNIETEDLHENTTKIDIEEEFQNQNFPQGEKADEDSVSYQQPDGEVFHTPETEETKLSSEETKENPIPTPQEAYLSKLALQFQQIEEGYCELLAEINKRKGIECLEQEIKLFFDFAQERQRCFQNQLTSLESPQDPSKETDLQAVNGELTSPMKNNEELSRSFETAQNSEENQSEKIETNSPPLDGKQKAEDLLQESPQEEFSQDHKTKETSQEKEENKQAQNYSLPQDLKFNPSYYLENGPKTETIVYQNGRQIEQQGTKPSTPRFFGLKNIGKTCYMNALFRCLFDVKPFYEEILRIKEYPKFPLISK